MKILLSFLIIFNLSIALADDGLVVVNSGNEIEAGLTAPGSTSSFQVTLSNSNSSDTATSIGVSFSSADYDFLGGSFPGLGGNCATSLSSTQSCSLMIEHSPSTSGDSDDLLSLNYQLTTTSLGVSHTEDIAIDGHSESLDVGGCSGLSPIVSAVNPGRLEVLTSGIITLTGYNFSVATNINVPSLAVSSINIIDPQHLSFQLTAPATPGNFDIEVQTECGGTTVSNGIEVIPYAWVDLRTAAGLTAANPVYTTAGISGYTVNPSFGLRINNTSNNWSKMLRFDGVCDSVNKDFDIVIYRTGLTKQFMPALWSSTHAVNPYPGTTSYYRQYIGFYIPSGTTTSVWGGQGGDGGTSWNQSFGSISVPAGGYYRYAFRGAGQGGQTLEVFEVDSNLNDISSVGSFVSNRPASPAVTVCPGLSPSTSGQADYYVTAVRVL